MTDARRALRTGTLAAHKRVDDIFSRGDLSSRASYRDFLIAQAAAFLPAEKALDRAGAGALLPDWQTRKRSQYLRADLLALGAPVPEPVATPGFASAAEVWGGLYVLEGSRLGGALLRRLVAPNFPAAFLGASPPPGAWGAFLAALNENLIAVTAVDQATSAAQRVFRMFEEAGSRLFSAQASAGAG